MGVGREGPVGRGPAVREVRDAARTAGAPEPEAARSAPEAPSPGRPGTPDRIAREAWAVLASVDGLGPVGLVGLVDRLGGPERVLAVATGAGGEARVAAALGSRTPRDVAGRIVDAAWARRAIAAAVHEAGLHVLTLDDPAYPPELAGIELPPPVLFVRGTLAAAVEQPCVAVVGTRRPTDAGRSSAARVAGALARAGAVVVSGLAVGIDAAAHAATVGVGGRTVAVIGGGHGEAIQRRHAGLAASVVASGGAIVSEHAPMVAPSRGTFPRRNRVISGLAAATVVVEAGLRSGALITAAWALEQGRGCFVVPGPMDAPASAGCLGLLRAYPDQVRVVASPAALVEDLELPAIGSASTPGAGPGGGRPVGAASPEAVLATLPGPVAAAARSLAGGARPVDHVVAATGLSVPGALAALTMLEDLELVSAAYGRYRLAGGLVDLA